MTVDTSAIAGLRRDALAASCLALPRAPKADAKVVGAAVTHIVSDTPVESHVYLSLSTGKPIYVTTAKGLWEVNQGHITLMKEQR